MDVLSVSPLRTGSVLWRSRPDRWTLTVVCKGTYALAPGEAALAPDQEEVRERDAHWDGDLRRSVYAPSDLAPFKPRADVMLVGHAYAPRSELTRSLTARLIVGEMEKAIEVVSPRVWTREGELREGPRWNKMPIRWEHAAGGVDTWNPVGVSPKAPPDAYGQRMLPNLQPPGLHLKQWADLFVTVGFGPIAPSWTLRRARLGRRAEGWSDEGWPQIPLDDDFDGEFFQAAPPDQQIETLHDDVAVMLEYLHPDHPRLNTKLPGLHPHAFVDVPGSAPHDLVMTADTLWIDTDRAIATVTWRGQVAVDGPTQPGRVVIALEEAGQRLTWAVVAARAGLTPLSGAPADSARTPPHGRPAMNTLPFRLAESTHQDASAAAPGAPGLGSIALGQPTLAGGTLAPAARAPHEGEAETSGPPPTPRTSVTPTPRQGPLQMAAAADNAKPVWQPQRAEPAEHTMVAGVSAPRLEVRVPAPAASALEITWLSSTLLGRLRKNGVWAQILSPGKGATRSTLTVVSVARPDSDEAAEQALEGDVTAIMVRATPSDADLEDSLFESTVSGGALAPELVLLSGELEPTFDDAASIGALVAAAAPLASGHPPLAELLERARAMAKTPLEHAPEVAAALRADILAAAAEAKPELAPDALESRVARALLAARAYQRRDLFGDTWVRALFTPRGGSPVPAYLPEPAARRLPLFNRFSARVLADVVPQQDQHEEAAVALKVAAIARVVTRTQRG